MNRDHDSLIHLASPTVQNNLYFGFAYIYKCFNSLIIFIHLQPVVSIRAKLCGLWLHIKLGMPFTNSVKNRFGSCKVGSQQRVRNKVTVITQPLHECLYGNSF